MRKDSAAPISETFSIVNAEDRLFKIWATVEVYDTQGQRVPIEIFKGVVPKLLTRTVPFHLEHTNKAVGEVVNYEFGTHPEFNAPGCLVTGKIYRGFQLDDEAWRGLQELALMASIGGQSSSNKPGDLEWVAPCEIALTKKGANPGAKVVEVAAMAKSDMKKDTHEDMSNKSDDMKKGQYFIKWRGREYFTDADNRVHAWERFWTHNIVEDEEAFKRETSYKDVMEKSDVSERAKAKSELKKEEMSDEYANEMAWRLFRKHWNGLSSQQQDKIQEEWDAQKSDVSERAKESKEHPELPKEKMNKSEEYHNYKGHEIWLRTRFQYVIYSAKNPNMAIWEDSNGIEGAKKWIDANLNKSDLTPRGEKEKESKEHPELPKETIDKIVEDRGKLGKADMEKPFAGYKDFAGCVAANKDKEDPKAYCATIMRSVEGEKMGKSEMEKATVTVTDEKKEPPAAQAQEAKEGKEEHAPEQKSDTPPAEVPREKAPEAREAPKPDAPDFESRLASIESNMQKVLEFMQKATEASAAAAPVKETAPVKEEKPAEAVKPEAPAKPEEPKTPESAKAEEKPKEKTEEEKKEDMGKAAVADMQKSAEPASTPRPPVNEMPFNPEKHAGKNTKLPTPAEIMKGAKLDTLDFVKEYFTKPGALRS
jgi:hypothetical protein